MPIWVCLLTHSALCLFFKAHSSKTYGEHRKRYPGQVPNTSDTPQVNTLTFSRRQTQSHSPDSRIGFHIPPFNSVQHLHLHVQALPYISYARQLKYPVARGFGAFDKGFSWFTEVSQTIRILDKGSTVAILPC
ncbi:hypothetical protein J3R83DRAFT_12578 [Lanmaoa asiatica]|nr:hypothetical protein J3R83DRAFT_12578 [Lanmaoa asiatica]